MYALQRYSDNKYVAKPGSQHSYVTRIEKAQVFSSREEADKNRCVESERITKVCCAC